MFRQSLIGERFYKIVGKKWDSFSYADVQLSFLLMDDGAGVTIGTGTGIILNEKELFYKYKIFTGLFGLVSYDHINFKNKPRNHWGGFIVFPFTNAKP